ncbi:gamma carbonic anhydrase family protein [Sciscionella sediminilitoris]|uniref:gamma carbonic anhydrase family protein n=1 Tax=Sciscionella sediminilitoris TaxID=1445613 RepID=UPI0004DF84EA|nr:gamma carbonic anhydrase family protein [Sciscionella sp. SE31]
MAIYALGELTPDIHPDAYVHPDATVIGDVRIGAQASIWPQAVLRADTAEIVVGERSNIQDGSIIHVSPGMPTVLGPGSAIGHNVHVEGAVIGTGCLIASGSVVLNGTEIADGGVVGAGAVMSYHGKVAGGEIALGVPAKCRENKSVNAEMVAAIVANYVERGAQFAKSLRRLD